MSILFFAGSLREESANKKFAREALRVTKTLSQEGEFIDLRDYAMPVYDADIQEKGFPETVKKLSARIAAAHALVIATPEYNGGIPGPLKNTLDWLSRDTPMALAGKHLLLLGASPGALGAVRGLWHTRVPFEAVGCFVFPSMMGLPNAYTAFDSDGHLKDEKQAGQLKSILEQFLNHSK